MSHDEADAVAARYARREVGDRYSPLRPEVMQMLHERQHALRRLLARRGLADPGALDLAEVGCGSGGNLLELLRLGFAPERLTGLELLPERHAHARRLLPAATALWLGDATDAPLAPQSQHIVLQATVFSSLLDDAAQAQLAAAMWRWLRPGGGVLWYDFTVNNPRNPDVRGVPLSRVRELFPEGRITFERITLAPPLARAACALHASMYNLLNLVPLLRTHVLAWVEKPR